MPIIAVKSTRPSVSLILNPSTSPHYCCSHSNYYLATTLTEGVKTWNENAAKDDKIEDLRYRWEREVQRCSDVSSSSVTDRTVLPYRIHSQPGADEHQGKHDEQDVAESLAFGVVGHFSSLQTQICCMININMTDINACK